MNGYPPEFKDIGRFVRARRMASNASDLKELPVRRRHVPYLTQTEFAELVGISSVVISQIEQGTYPNLTTHVLKRISQVLDFSQQQEAFMLGLSTPASSVPQRGREEAPEWLLESIRDTRHPVFVFNPAYDLLGWSEKATEMFGDYTHEFFAVGSVVTPVFRMPQMKDFFADWDEFATSMVSGLRMSYGVHADYREYVRRRAEELSLGDPYFSSLWEKDDPLVVPTIEKELNHPGLGRMKLVQVITQVVEVPELTMAEFFPADEDTRRKLWPD